MSAKEDAKAIRNAIKGLGTDDEKLVEILTKRSNEQLIAVANEYTASFGISIYDDIKGDTSIYNNNNNNNKMNKNTLFSLSVHDTQFSKEELVINPDCFPANSKPKLNDIIEIGNLENHKKLYLPVKTLGPVKGNLQVSVAKYIASVFEFSARRDVSIRVVTPDQARVDYVELSFKDQYIGRSGNYKELLVGLVQAKPTYLARVVHNAVKGAGTDEAALIDAIVHQPNAVIKATGEAYQKLFNKSMSGDISGDTSGDFKKLFVGLCSAHRDESNNFDPAKAQADAELLYKKGEGKIGTDEETFIEFFLTRSFAHIREVNKLYNQKRGHDLAVAIDSEFSGNIRRGLKALALSREDYWASRIRKAIKGLGTNDAVLVRAFVINSREQLKQIEQAYNTYEERKKGKGKKEKKDKKDKKGKKASNSLVNDIKGDTSGWYEKSLLGLLQ